MIDVFHNQDRDTLFRKAGSFPADYLKVATVDVADADYGEVFYLTNSVDGPWWKNKGVAAHFDSPAFFEVEEHPGVKGTRSTSVGDVIVLSDGRKMECKSVGWAELNTQGGAA